MPAARPRVASSGAWFVALALGSLVLWSRLGGAAADAPTPQPAPASLRSVETIPPPDGGGAHAFTQLQADGVTPVAWDPCRPIRIVVNRRGAPAAADGLLAEALAEVESRTGLVFEVEGTTSEPPRPDRPAFQPDRYGDRWAPVLVAWSDAEEVPDLEGYAGLGGADAARLADGTLVYVSGTVTLDGPLFAHYLGADYRPDFAMAVMLHELGHLVGLAHVDDWTELMHGGGEPHIVDWGPGDLAGLARLGQGRCVPHL